MVSRSMTSSAYATLGSSILMIAMLGGTGVASSAIMGDSQQAVQAGQNTTTDSLLQVTSGIQLDQAVGLLNNSEVYEVQMVIGLTPASPDINMSDIGIETVTATGNSFMFLGDGYSFEKLISDNMTATTTVCSGDIDLVNLTLAEPLRDGSYVQIVFLISEGQTDAFELIMPHAMTGSCVFLW